MKNQSKIDGQKIKQIFNTNFSKEILNHKTTRFTSLFSLQKRLLSNNYILISSIVFSLSIAVNLGFWTVLSSTSPLSMSKKTLEIRNYIEEKQLQQSQIVTTIKNSSHDIETLQVRGALDSIPELASSQDIFRRKINWFRIYVGIDQTIHNIIAGNNILKKIQIGSIIFKSKDESILLDRVKAIGTLTNQDGSTGGSNISLAAKLVDTLEQSPYAKEVKTENYTNKKNISTTSGSTMNESFTPLTISAKVQNPEEKNINDQGTSIEEELQNIQNNNSNLPTAQ